MDQLTYIVANVDEFAAAGIQLDTERKTLDGTKAIRHINTLTTEQWQSIRFNENFVFLSEQQTVELVAGPEWTSIET